MLYEMTVLEIEPEISDPKAIQPLATSSTAIFNSIDKLSELSLSQVNERAPLF